MLVLEFKAKAKTTQYAAIDDAIRTAQFVRNKCIRFWMDNQGVGQKELYRQNTALRAEFPFVKALNSHACQVGDLFIGMPGTRVDGGEFWQSAIASGAIAALVSSQVAQKRAEEAEEAEGAEGACIISATDIVKACAGVAAAFYGYPANQMRLVG